VSTLDFLRIQNI